MSTPDGGGGGGWHEEPTGLIERTPIHEGRVVRLSLDRVRFPDGATGELEFIRHRGAAAVVPFLDPPEDPDPRIVLLRQHRYAAGGTIYEIPAGIIDPEDESWEACAHRELEEESGYRAGTLHYLSRIYTTPGFTNEVIHLFAATGLEEGSMDRDHDEYLEVVAEPLSKVLEGIRTGRIVDGKTVSGILLAHTFLPQARAEGRRAPEPPGSAR
jgi:ADP-ribose pyrophosphatase